MATAVKRLTIVRSSMLHAVGYDRATRTLEAVFNDGGIFFYADVPRSVYSALLAAPSIGGFMREAVIDVYPAVSLARSLAATKKPARRRAR